jgi:ankyrin repeat protein
MFVKNGPFNANFNAFDANVDVATARGSTPLMWVIATAEFAFVRLLLALNADVTKEDSSGWTVSQTDDEDIKQPKLDIQRNR